MDYLPSPLEVTAPTGINPDINKEVTRAADDEEPFSGLVFKIMTDPFVGRLSYVRVYSGTLSSGMQVLNANSGKKSRIGKLLEMQ